MQTFQTPGPVTLRVTNGGGVVDVRTADTTETSVHLKALNEAGEQAVTQARVELDRDTVVVEVPRRHGLLRRGPEVEIEISAPVGSSLAVKTESSDIRAVGSYTDADCSTGSGDVALDDVRHDTRVRSGSGDLSLGRTGGRLDATTGSGDVAVDETGEQARIASGSGDVSIGRLLGTVGVKTGSGDVVVGVLTGSLDTKSGSGDLVVRRATSGSVRSSGANGDVVVGVEQGTAAWLDVQSVHGDVVQELDGAESPTEGQPVVEISVTTVGGDLRVHRA